MEGERASLKKESVNQNNGDTRRKRKGEIPWSVKEEREREREREREKERERQTDKQINRQTDRQIERQ